MEFFDAANSVDTSIKVITFNLRYDSESDPQIWDERKSLVYKTIREMDPDLIGLQEVQVHMLSDLIAEFEENYFIYGESRDESENPESTPVMARKSRFKLLEKNSFMLSETPDLLYSKGWDSALARIASYFILQDLKDEQELVFLNTHFDYLGKVARLESSKQCAEFMQAYAYQGIPVILTADFNLFPESELLAPLMQNPLLDNSYDKLSTAYKMAALTYHAYKGGSKGSPIDHIFVNRPWRIAEVMINRYTENGFFPSDHYPVECKVYK